LEYFFHSFRRYDFKSTLSQNEIFKKILRYPRGILGGLLLASGVVEKLAISEVARVFGLRTSAIRYYETDRHSSGADAKEWSTLLQQERSLSPRCGAARTRNRVHSGGNTRALFRVPTRDASAETLAPTFPAENRGAPRPNEAA
jgi:hypothetical protein